MPIDLLTVVEELRIREELDGVGGPVLHYQTHQRGGFFGQHRSAFPHHSPEIHSAGTHPHQRRIIGDACEDSTDVFDMLDDAEGKLFEITNNHLRKNFDSIDTVLVKTIQRIEDMRNRQEDITGVPTGFPSLDKLTYGWQPTDLIILAARPSVGKTAFALNLAERRDGSR